ncbi:hypothetical protein ACVW17_003218 [Bradyrhizobium sp. USDA 4473]
MGLPTSGSICRNSRSQTSAWRDTGRRAGPGARAGLRRCIRVILPRQRTTAAFRRKLSYSRLRLISEKSMRSLPPERAGETACAFGIRCWSADPLATRCGNSAWPIGVQNQYCSADEHARYDRAGGDSRGLVVQRPAITARAIDRARRGGNCRRSPLRCGPCGHSQVIESRREVMTLLPKSIRMPRPVEVKERSITAYGRKRSEYSCHCAFARERLGVSSNETMSEESAPTSSFCLPYSD